MTIYEVLLSLPYKKVTLVATLIFSTIISPAILIAVANLSFFTEVEIARVFIIASGIGIPIFALNTIVAFIVSAGIKNKLFNESNDRVETLLIASAFFTFLPIYSTILMQLLWEFSFRDGLMVLAFNVFLVPALMGYFTYKEHKNSLRQPVETEPEDTPD